MARYGWGQGVRPTAIHLLRKDRLTTACNRAFKGRMEWTEREDRVTCLRCLDALERERP